MPEYIDGGMNESDTKQIKDLNAKEICRGLRSIWQLEGFDLLTG